MRVLTLHPPARLRPRIEGGPAVAPPVKDVPNDILAQCPYCGVGCGTLIQTEKGRIVGMKPDPKHPTNRGLQCIKGLTSAEAIYVDRLTKPLIRKDMTDPITGRTGYTERGTAPPRERGKELLRSRGMMLERPFAHGLATDIESIQNLVSRIVKDSDDIIDMNLAEIAYLGPTHKQRVSKKAA